MKILSVFVVGLSLLELSCSKSYQTKCSEKDVQDLVKQICARNYNRDTSEITVSSIRTVGMDERFNSCDCSANVQAD